MLLGLDTKAQSGWTTIDTVNNVIISYQVDSMPCYGETAMFLKIENTGQTNITVSWSLWGDGVFKEITLTAQEVVTGNCNDVTPPYVLIERIPFTMSPSNITPVINVF